MSRRRVELPRNLVLGEDYWLSRCDGFAVEADGRRVGVVGEVRFGTRLDRPDALVVHGGLFGTRTLVVPTADVLAVVPRRARIELAASPSPVRARDPLPLRHRIASAVHRAARVRHA